jgi:hypothetical protein
VRWGLEIGAKHVVRRFNAADSHPGQNRPDTCVKSIIMIRVNKLCRAARLVLATGLLSLGTSAMAQTTDISNVTCANFLTLNAADQAQLALWLAGYFAGSAQRPVINRALTGAAPAALLQLCTKMPAILLIGAETRPLFVLPPNQ